jgi:hypothetical protein
LTMGERRSAFDMNASCRVIPRILPASQTTSRSVWRRARRALIAARLLRRSWAEQSTSNSAAKSNSAATSSPDLSPNAILELPFLIIAFANVRLIDSPPRLTRHFRMNLKSVTVPTCNTFGGLAVTIVSAAKSCGSRTESQATAFFARRGLLQSVKSGKSRAVVAKRPTFMRHLVCIGMLTLRSALQPAMVASPISKGGFGCTRIELQPSWR